MSLHRSSLWLLMPLLLAGCTHGSATDPIIIGHLAPFSGPDKMRGEHARQGIMLAVEEINADNEKINGRRVEVHHADDQGSSTAAGDEAVRLITVTRAVALLGGLSSDRAEPIARAAQPYGIPLVTPSQLPLPLASEIAFSTCLTPTQQGKTLGRFAAEELKVKHVAVLIDNRSAVCTGVAAGFAKEFEAPGERQADRYRYVDDAGLADLPGRAAKVKADAVVIATSVADFVKLREGLIKAEVKGPILFGGEELALPSLFAEPDAGRDVYAVTTFAIDGLTQRGQEFAKKYQERFKEPLDLYAASAYDGARLLFETMRRVKSSEPERVRNGLPGFENFEGLTGPLSIDKDDHGARRPAFVVQRQQGQTKVVKRYDAGNP